MDRQCHLAAVVHELADARIGGWTVNEDGVNPFLADVVGSVFKFCDYRDARNFLFRNVPVKYDADDLVVIHGRLFEARENQLCRRGIKDCEERALLVI